MIFNFNDFSILNEEYKEVDEIISTVDEFLSSIKKDIYNFRNDIEEYNQCAYNLNDLLEKPIEQYLDGLLKKVNINIVFFYNKNEDKHGYIIAENNKKIYNIYLNINNDVFRFNLLTYANDKFLLFRAIEIAFRSTLIHEIKHAYDFYRTEHTILLDKKRKIFKEKTKDLPEDAKLPPELLLLYFKLPTEVWARFAQALAQMKNFDNFDDFVNTVKNFKNVFVKYDVLSEKQKRKLLKKLYQYFEYYNENKNKLNDSI